jgi:Cysteine rich repeat
MKATPGLLITALVLSSAFAQVQAQESGRADKAVARACKDDAQHLCSGKTGQELQQCLKSNQAQLSSNCKEAVSKLPNPPKS